MTTASATISSKRQITIPSIFFNHFGFSKGDLLVFKKEVDGIKIKKALDLVNEVAGSLEVPEHMKNVDIDEAIRTGKEEHFKNQR